MSNPISPAAVEALRRHARDARIVIGQLRGAVEMGLDYRPDWRFAEGLREAWREALPDVAPPVLTETGDYGQAQQAVDLFLRAVESREALPPAPTRRGGAKGKRIDERMLATIRDDKEALYWTCREWADFLRCHHTTVAGTKTWKEVCLRAQEIARQTNGKRMHRRRNVG
jgi:hypothetical protein